jgi:DNA-binding NtrC family response regulator
MAKGDIPTRSAVNDPRAAVQTAHTLLIVDDEPSLRFSIGEWARDSGLEPLEAASGREALAQLRERGADVVLLDLRLGEEDGLQVLRSIREEDPELPVIMLTGHGGVEHAVRATRLGAYDFIEKKPPYLEHLEVVVRRALEHARLKHEVEHLRTGTQKDQALFGESPGLRRALQRLEKVARSNTATVLLQGETGSGKELMARYVHAQSARANGPFIDLNCSAIPEHLLESQLFGHEKGAFTDAKHFKKGLFELADGGTLFLDEIGEMPTQLQSKLLRVLESRTFRRVGGQVDITVDVRMVAATHRDLPRAVAEGKFREDLYYRLNVVPISMPPLRERTEDIALLAEHFIRRFCGELGRPPSRLHPDALKAMREYAWPGNVRELKNVIERVVLLEAEEEIRLEHLPAELTRRPDAAGDGAKPTPFPPGVVRPLAEIEMLAIEHALGVCSGNKTRAAQLLGISRQTLRTKLKEFAMEDDAEEVDPGAS